LVALIFPSDEDFGLVSLEAQSFCVPVVAYRRGGSLETVVEGKTGCFFEEQKGSSIVDMFLSKGRDFDAVRDYFAKFEEIDFTDNLECYSKENFTKQFISYIDKGYNNKVGKCPHIHNVL
jgi:glycosyltransferase involved in cell wall biosynthesis